MLLLLYLDVCVLLGGFGAATAFVSIIPGEDSNFVVRTGATASLRCLVSSLLTVTKWTNGSRALVASSRVHLSSNLEMLMIFSVTEEDEGKYYCYATSTGGDVEHASADLYVVGRPSAVTTNATVQPGQRAVLTCTGKNFNYLSWDFKGQPVEEDSNHILHEYNLIVKSTLPDDAGVYKCRAFNQFFSLNVNAYLTLEVNCVDNKNLVNKAISVGTTVTLCCSNKTAKTANTNSSTLWKRNEVVLEITPSRRLYMLSGSSLIITRTQYNDSGMYTCLRNSKVYTTNLIVQGPPPQPVVQEMRMTDVLLVLVQWSVPAPTPQHPVAQFRVSCRPSMQQEWWNATASRSARSAMVECNIAEDKERVAYYVVVTAINKQGETQSQLSCVSYNAEIPCSMGGITMPDVSGTNKNGTNDSGDVSKFVTIGIPIISGTVLVVICAIIVYCSYKKKNVVDGPSVSYNNLVEVLKNF